jgi:hypothetical protein
MSTKNKINNKSIKNIIFEFIKNKYNEKILFIFTDFM